MMADERKPRYLTVKEYAGEERIHEETVYKLISQGKIRGVRRVGRTIRIDRFLALNTRRSTDADE